MSIEITIAQVPKSPNQLLRMHWRERHKYNKQIEREVWIAKSWEGTCPGRPEHSPVTIDIELRLCGHRELDPDNAVGACKPIIDALVSLGIIKDDDPATVLAVNVTQKRTPRYQAGALIRVTPAT